MISRREMWYLRMWWVVGLRECWASMGICCGLVTRSRIKGQTFRGNVGSVKFCHYLWRAADAIGMGAQSH